MKMATPEQVNYLAILFSDCGIDLKAKKAILKADYNVEYTDELTIYQASVLIEALKKLKEDKE